MQASEKRSLLISSGWIQAAGIVLAVGFLIMGILAGFYRPQFFRRWKVADYQKPSDALLATGLKPSDITEIIITHMHWDHVDGFDLFPKAHIWIQRDEYTYYTGEAWHHPHTHGGIDTDDVMAIVQANIAGMVSFVEGDNQEILPGITC